MRTLRTLALLGALTLTGPALANPAPVDINTADAQTLADTIRGVGLKRAEAIIAEREKNGPFTSVDDLTRVQGIGERIVEDARADLTVSPAK